MWALNRSSSLSKTFLHVGDVESHIGAASELDKSLGATDLISEDSDDAVRAILR